MLPSHAAWSDLEVVRATCHTASAPLGHGPALTAFAVECDVDGAVVVGLHLLALPGKGPGVIRRKNAANKSNNAQRVLAIVTDGVDIPPEVRPRFDLLVKSRSAITVSAARRPEIAAIGTPGPGCTLPPAR